jgi:hypothetical protein
MKENPGAGQCSWADRVPEGTEQPGTRAVLLGNLGPFDSLPVNTMAKICVSRADASPGQNNVFVVRQVVRQLGHQTAPYNVPPFNAEGC